MKDSGKTFNLPQNCLKGPGWGAAPGSESPVQTLQLRVTVCPRRGGARRGLSDPSPLVLHW